MGLLLLQHDNLEENRNKDWMQQGSSAYQALTQIVLNACWLKIISASTLGDKELLILPNILLFQ